MKKSLRSIRANVTLYVDGSATDGTVAAACQVIRTYNGAADELAKAAATTTATPLGRHTLGIECKGVLSTGVDRMLVGNRVGVGLTHSAIISFAPI